jgi:sugar-specific transcriptional regulator TrmB
VEVLMSLGLTGRQARVYLAMLKSGGGKAKAIADLSLVHRQEIYRLIDSLQQIGLVQRNITAPTTFTALPIAGGTKLLLQQKTSELSVMCRQAKLLTKKLSQPTTTSYHQEKTPAKPCLGTVFEGDRGKKYSQAIQEAQHTIETVTSWRRFKQLSIHFETQLLAALKKGVTIRVVTEKPPNLHLPKWIDDTALSEMSFKLKIIQTPPTAAITIFDQTTAAIAFNPHLSLTKGPDLWTTNSTLTALCQTYFRASWT